MASPFDPSLNYQGTKTLAGLLPGVGLSNQAAGISGRDQLNVNVDGATLKINANNQLYSDTTGITSVGVLNGLNVNGAVTTRQVGNAVEQPHHELLSTSLAPRFKFGLSGAETGGNAGANFRMWRYADGGNFLGTYYEHNRANGRTTWYEVEDATNTTTAANIFLGGIACNKNIWSYGLKFPGAIGQNFSLVSSQASPKSAILAWGDGTGWQLSLEKSTGGTIGLITDRGQLILNGQTIASTSTTTGNIVAPGGAGFGGRVFANGLDANSQTVSNVASPIGAADAANKDYVDSVASGVKVKTEVVAASTGNVTLTAPGATLDGFTLTNGDRILLKNQTTAMENGVYIFNGASSTATRATDFAVGVSAAGFYILTKNGSTNQGNGYVVSNVAPSDVIGTNALVFTQFAANRIYNFSTGLTDTSNTVTVNAAQPQITSVGTLTSLTTSGAITSGGLITAQNGINSTGGSNSFTNNISLSNSTTIVQYAKGYYGHAAVGPYTQIDNGTLQRLTNFLPGGFAPSTTMSWFDNGTLYQSPDNNGLFTIPIKGTYMITITITFDGSVFYDGNPTLRYWLYRVSDNVTFLTQHVPTRTGVNANTCTASFHGSPGDQYDIKFYTANVSGTGITNFTWDFKITPLRYWNTYT